MALLLLGFFLILGAYILFKPGGRASSPEATASSTPITAPKALPWKTIEETIDKGETLSEILAEYGLSPAEIDRLCREVKPVFDFKKIRAGRTLKIILEETGTLRALEYPTDDRHYVVVTSENGVFSAVPKAYPLEKKIAYVDGVVEESLYEAIVAAKESPTLSWEIEDLFGWDIDFWAGLRRGDAFRAVYEKVFIDGAFAGYGDVLVAEFWNQGNLFRAFRFAYPDTGTADHFDASGNSLRKEFLRSPLKSSRITSRFSFNRLHPIRKIRMAHYGVDYGAPEGTPVFATADGVVLEAGWKGAAGRMIRLKHKNNFETLYLHLASILVKAKGRVVSGQQIGTVGRSGEATGPHLDYRIKEGGSYVNPLSKKFAPVEPLRPEFKEAFAETTVRLEALLDSPKRLFRIR
jgi:murein DD-endopeptidase MepM/ murein hydrolase activator NlpD